MGTISYVKGDIFSAPPGSILVHACNTQGSWGGGIALDFRAKYPTQYDQYHAYCKEQGQALIGTCHLIRGGRHDVACLFTSRAYGKRKDSPEQIIAATRTALQSLMDQNTESKALHAWYDLQSCQRRWHADLQDRKIAVSTRANLLSLGLILRLFCTI